VKGKEETLVNWIWPGNSKSDDRLWVRMVRLAHWIIVAFAIFGLVVSFIGMLVGGNRELVSYAAVGFVWIALAMLGRGIRYVLLRE
jgi:cytochrome b